MLEEELLKRAQWIFSKKKKIADISALNCEKCAICFLFKGFAKLLSKVGVTYVCYQQILFPKLFWETVRKNILNSDRGKYLKFEAVEKFYNFLNNERKVQFLKQNTFSTCFWRFLRLQFTNNGMHKLEQLEFKSQNIIGI